jgi:histidinol-phosphate/aromatic aminotransferase/cobyric acid decarboxylase-like protein
LLEGAAALADAGAGIVVLDEAYADFAGTDETARAAASERLLVLRTFSKAYGLAGLRIGYAVGPARLIRELEKARGPYKVGGLAEAAALAVLRQDRTWVQQRTAEAVRTRERLARELNDRGLRPLPSAANFLLVPVPGAGDVARRLREAGVAVRAFGALPHLGDALRVTVGPWPMLERFLAALDALPFPSRG